MELSTSKVSGPKASAMMEQCLGARAGGAPASCRRARHGLACLSVCRSLLTRSCEDRPTDILTREYRDQIETRKSPSGDGVVVSRSPWRDRLRTTSHLLFFQRTPLLFHLSEQRPKPSTPSSWRSYRVSSGRWLTFYKNSGTARNVRSLVSRLCARVAAIRRQTAAKACVLTFEQPPLHGVSLQQLPGLDLVSGRRSLGYSSIISGAPLVPAALMQYSSLESSPHFALLLPTS